VSAYAIRQLATELPFPESGKKSVVVQEDERTKVVLFAFAAGGGLPEHVAPLPAILQIVAGEAAITVGEERVVGVPGTWISMPPQTPHSIAASQPTLLLLTLLKG
jgi:quercetin dioxygenase-like cupin family protein